MESVGVPHCTSDNKLSCGKLEIPSLIEASPQTAEAAIIESNNDTSTGSRIIHSTNTSKGGPISYTAGTPPTPTLEMIHTNQSCNYEAHKQRVDEMDFKRNSIQNNTSTTNEADEVGTRLCKTSLRSISDVDYISPYIYNSSCTFDNNKIPFQNRSAAEGNTQSSWMSIQKTIFDELNETNDDSNPNTNYLSALHPQGDSYSFPLVMTGSPLSAYEVELTRQTEGDAFAINYATKAVADCWWQNAEAASPNVHNKLKEEFSEPSIDAFVDQSFTAKASSMSFEGIPNISFSRDFDSPFIWGNQPNTGAMFLHTPQTFKWNGDSTQPDPLDPPPNHFSFDLNSTSFPPNFIDSPLPACSNKPFPPPPPTEDPPHHQTVWDPPTPSEGHHIDITTVLKRAPSIKKQTNIKPLFTSKQLVGVDIKCVKAAEVLADKHYVPFTATYLPGKGYLVDYADNSKYTSHIINSKYTQNSNTQSDVLNETEAPIIGLNTSTINQSNIWSPHKSVEEQRQGIVVRNDDTSFINNNTTRRTDITNYGISNTLHGGSTNKNSLNYSKLSHQFQKMQHSLNDALQLAENSDLISDALIQKIKSNSFECR